MYIVVHLAMSGKWIYTKNFDMLSELSKKHSLVELKLDDGGMLIYSDHRRFGAISIYTEEEFLSLDNIHKLGPEPFLEDSDKQFLKNIRNKRYLDKEIKGVIMDQRVVAGVGNIYACESLYILNINPKTKVSNLSDFLLLDLFHVFKELMLFSISVGGSSVSDYVNGEGKRGTFQNYLNVYHVKKCKCGTEITRETIAGRTTHYCENCQII